MQPRTPESDDKPLLDVKDPGNKGNSEKFLKFAQEELARLEALHKPTNKNEENNLVWRWAVNVYKRGTGIDLTLSFFSKIPDGILYGLSQRGVTSDPNVDQLWNIYYMQGPTATIEGRMWCLEYEFLHLLLVAAVCPYPAGRPDLSELKEFVKKGVKAGNLVVDYTTNLMNQACTANNELKKDLEKKELNKNNFNSLQEQGGSFQSQFAKSEERYAKLEERFARLEQLYAKSEERLNRLESENQELKKENQELKAQILKAKESNQPTQDQSGYSGRLFGRGGR